MMTLAELSQFTREHGNRLVALESTGDHLREKIDGANEANKELDKKIDRLQWAVIGVLSTSVVQLVIVILNRLPK